MNKPGMNVYRMMIPGMNSRQSLLRPYSPLLMGIPLVGLVYCAIGAAGSQGVRSLMLPFLSLAPLGVLGWMTLSNRWSRPLVLACTLAVIILCARSMALGGPVTSIPPLFLALLVMFSVCLPYPDSLPGITGTALAAVATLIAGDATAHDAVTGTAWFLTASAVAALHSYSDMRMRDFTIHDSLTGVYRRSILMASLEDALRHSERYREPVSLLFIDLDNFKHINDSYGHLGGDEVLKRVGRLIKGSIRSTDYVARWGGDEFVVLMRNLQPNTVSGIAERLRAGVEGHFRDSEGLTISVGICSVTGGCEPESLLGMADTALYMAKHQGRNRVVVAAS